jgi:hypothetical protein
MNETEKAEFDSLMTTGVPLGLLTFLVALTRIIVRVLYSVVFGVRQDSATFARIGAVVNLKVEDYYPSGKRFLLRRK